MKDNIEGIVCAVIGAIAGIIVGTILTSIFNGTEELLWGDRWLPWIYYGIPILVGLRQGYEFGSDAIGFIDFTSSLYSIWTIIKTILLVLICGLAIGIIMFGIAVFLNLLNSGELFVMIALVGIFGTLISTPVIYIVVKIFNN